MRIRQSDFVAQARVNGASGFRIMIRHIFPNIVNSLIIIMTLSVGMIILAEAALSFLGIGITAPTASWGSMVSDGRSELDRAWWISAFPGICIGLVVLSGNFLGDWRAVADTLGDVGFPIIEASADGSFVVTKHAGTGGLVSVATVTEQLVYEMGDPHEYITPDVVADFTTIRLVQEGPDRVRVHGVRGRPRTDRLKVSIAYHAGYKAVGTLVYAWPDAVAKAQAADRILRARLERLALRFDEIRTEFVGWNATHGALVGPPPPDLAEVELRVGVRGPERAAVERFTRELAPLILTGPPSVTGFAGGRPRVQDVVAYWPALIDRREIEPRLRVEVSEA